MTQVQISQNATIRGNHSKPYMESRKLVMTGEGLSLDDAEPM
eukprot:CAMPEP_0205916092 /NCGR_PEP_ID=MMETSP1325-20131115/8286_1 /ASSEMBLY_ACC=CAM_ASM_000708 /TAXON_ID=236786 /ORGANISM="Florenciella sp., Strain RCC1007" /LENGTH=41 /DNA_ID= /DNA_START= /DNA_END= /DNA_ORIENTATION=